MSPLKSIMLTTSLALCSILNANGQNKPAIEGSEKDTTSVATQDTLLIGDLTIVRLSGEKRDVKTGLVCGGYFDRNRLLVDSADFVHIKTTPATQQKLIEGMAKVAQDKENRSHIGEFHYYQVGTIAVLNGVHYQNKGSTTIEETRKWFDNASLTLNSSMHCSHVYAHPFNHRLNNETVTSPLKQNNPINVAVKNPSQ